MATALLVLGGSAMEMMFSVLIEGITPARGARLEHVLEEAMERLIAAGAQDPAIGMVGAEGSFEISVTVEAPSLDQAVANGLAVVREALAAKDMELRGAHATPVQPTSA